MTDNLEASLRRAVGLELTDANGDTEEPLPGIPGIAQNIPPPLFPREMEAHKV